LIHILRLTCLLVSLIGGLAGCQSDHNRKEENTAVQDAIRFGLNTAPVNLNPLQATDAVSSRIIRLIYQPLISFGQDDKPVPNIAQWQQLTAKHYRFTLIKQPVFHHGKSLTVNDIKATYDAVLDTRNASPHRNSLKHIEQIVIVDEKTIDFHLNRADPIFPAFLVVGIMPLDLLEKQHPFNTRPIGSGAFKFVSWPYSGQLFLQRQSDQQAFEFLEVKNPTVRVLKLIKGELDMLQNNLPPEHIAYLKKVEQLNYIRHKGVNYSYLGFNLQDETTANPVIRKAIAHAIDRDRIIRFALGDAAEPANSFFPEQHWVSQRFEGYEFDPRQARTLMKSLGYSEHRRLALSYKTSSDPFRIRIASIIQSQLKDIFIDVSIKSYDWGTFFGDIKQGRFQLYSLTWVGIKSPDIFRYVFHSSSLPPTGANRGRLNDKQIDQLIEQAEQEQDLQEQADLYRRLQMRLNERLPYVSLWYEDNLAFFNKQITGYQLSGDGHYDGLKLVTRQINDQSMLRIN
jgi:peptide/nickel transport system substrate-binding protein